MGRRAYVLGASMLFGLILAGCSGADDRPGATQSCTPTVRFEGRGYREIADADYEVGQRAGTARLRECDGGTRAVRVFLVPHLDRSLAVAAGKSRQEAVFYALDEGAYLPPMVESYLAQH